MRLPGSLAIFMVAVACSSPQASSTPSPASAASRPISTPTPGPTASAPWAVIVYRAGEGEPYYVQLVRRDGRGGPWVQPVTRSAKVFYFPPTACPQGGMCAGSETANYRLPETSVSDTHVYFLDADTVIKSMAVDGTVAVVKTIHALPNSQVAFSVSPDDRRIAVSIITLATSNSPEPINVSMYVEDLTEQTNRVSLYSSKTLAEWPIGWHAGNLVVAVGSQDIGTYDNAYAATGYQVVDPATGGQLVTLDCARGLLVVAGTACASGFCPSGTTCGPGTLGRQGWDGSKTTFRLPSSPPPGIFLAFANGVELSPDGTSVAAEVISDPQASSYDAVLFQDAKSTTIGPGLTPAGWLDGDHLVVLSSQDQMLIMDLTAKTSIPVFNIQAIHGQRPEVVGTLPANLG